MWTKSLTRPGDPHSPGPGRGAADPGPQRAVYLFWRQTQIPERSRQSVPRAKKAEIAKNFYFVTGETMAILKKTVTLRKKWSLAQSAASLQNISRETKKLDEQFQKLDTGNWKQNLVGLYFDVALLITSSSPPIPAPTSYTSNCSTSGKTQPGLRGSSGNTLRRIQYGRLRTLRPVRRDL